MEIAASELEPLNDLAMTEIENAHKEVTRIEEAITQQQRRARQDGLRCLLSFILDRKVDSSEEAKEFEIAREKITAARQQIESLYERREELRHGGTRLATEATKMTTITATLVLLVGFGAEIFALLGILGIIDRFLSIAVPAISVGFLLATLAELALFRLRLTVGLKDFRWPARIIVASSNILLYILPIAFGITLPWLLQGTP